MNGVSSDSPRSRATVEAGIGVAGVLAAFAVVVAYDADPFRPAERATGDRLPRVPWMAVEVPPRAVSGDAASEERGRTAFRNLCAPCHGEAGRGDGPAAAALRPAPRDFSLGRFRLKTTPAGNMPSDADLFRTLTAGVLPSRMPSFAVLPAADRWALVDRVKALAAFHDEEEDRDLNHFALKPPGEAVRLPPAPEPGSAARGREVYAAKGGCIQCHGAEGRGNGSTAAEMKDEKGLAIRPADLTLGRTHFKAGSERQDIVRVLLTGLEGTPMPSQAGNLSAQELWDLAEFVRSHFAPDGAPPDASSLAYAGRSVFLRECAGCHGPSGAGDGPASPDLSPRPRDLSAGIFKLRSTPAGELPTDADLHRTLLRGLPGSSMPGWPLLPQGEREALVAFLKTLSPRWRTATRGAAAPAAGPPTPDPAAPAARGEGRALFATYCAACHGPEGRGDGPLAPLLQDIDGRPVRPRDLAAEPFRGGATPADVFRTVTTGMDGSAMPAFAGLLTDAERGKLAAYVVSLQLFRAKP